MLRVIHPDKQPEQFKKVATAVFKEWDGMMERFAEKFGPGETWTAGSGGQTWTSARAVNCQWVKCVDVGDASAYAWYLQFEKSAGYPGWYIVRCRLCDMECAPGHLESKKHKQKFEEAASTFEDKLVAMGMSVQPEWVGAEDWNGRKHPYCTVCKTYLTVEHLEGEKHNRKFGWSQFAR